MDVFITCTTRVNAAHSLAFASALLIFPGLQSFLHDKTVMLFLLLISLRNEAHRLTDL